jgi:L-ascorbate metabolism protein UlaG (beta-lactamase superfamily)
MKYKLFLSIMSISLFACHSISRSNEPDTFRTPKGDMISIHFIKHASLMITFQKENIEIDPVSNLAPATDYTQYPKADYIFVTHSHFDHFYPEVITTLSKNTTKIILNEDCHNKLQRGFVMRNGDSLILGKGLSVKAVPAYNVTKEHLQFHPKSRDNGYILNIEGLRIYIAGDTEYIPEMNELKHIDIAFLPCNQPYTMTPAQVVEAAKVIKPKVLYPYHYNNTDLSVIVEELKNSGIDVRIKDMK